MKQAKSTGRIHAFCGWFLALTATYLAVFVLPFQFPLRHPVLSDVWIAGANNQVAAIALILVSIAVTCVLWRRDERDPSPSGTPGTLQRRYLIAAIAAAIAWTAILGSTEARIHTSWGDEAYFLTQLRTGLVFHQTLYRGFEFAYGPALYLWPAMCIRALAPLGFSAAAAYLVSLAILQAAGLGLLFYTAQALPLRRSLKTCAFLLISAGAFNTLLGLNYTVLRFILPIAAMVLLARQKSIAAAVTVATAGEIAGLAVSPELGIAFAAAASVYAITAQSCPARAGSRSERPQSWARCSSPPFQAPATSSPSAAWLTAATTFSSSPSRTSFSSSLLSSRSLPSRSRGPCGNATAIPG